MGASGAIDPRGIAGGRPPKTDMQAAMRAILYLLRTGCPWRYLPRDSFPPRSTVYNIFPSSSVMASGRRFGPSCTWCCANGWAGRRARRRRFSTAHQSSQRKKGRQRRPSGVRRRQEGQGRKIHAQVDSEGLPMRVVVHSAAIRGSDAASRGSNRSGPMAATMHGKLMPPWQRCHGCAWRSSSGATT